MVRATRARWSILLAQQLAAHQQAVLASAANCLSYRLAHSGRRGARLEIEVAGDPDSPMEREAVVAKFCRYAEEQANQSGREV